MPDKFSSEKRSAVMARVRGRDTKPEIAVRRILHSLGYRFRLHRRDLPGNPDIVLPRHRKIIFVHGCFWHGHSGCARASRPATNVDFWNRKLDGNKQRDAQTLQKLGELGWDVLVVWQCRTKDAAALKESLRQFMSN